MKGEKYMSIKNKNLKLEADIQALSTIVNSYDLGTKIGNIQKAYNKILADYNDFIVSSTLDKINIAYKADATGKQGKYNDQDEKHNQLLIDDVKKQVKTINQNLKDIGSSATVNGKIRSDNIFERIGEIGLGDGYYIKKQIGSIINNQLNPHLEFLNEVIKEAKKYAQVLNDTIVKNIKNAKDEVEEAARKTNGTKIVVGGKDKMESYKNKLNKTSSSFVTLKKECKSFATKLEKLNTFSTKSVELGSSSESSRSNSKTWEDFASH